MSKQHTQGWVGVTGAAGGLGREFCRQLKQQGLQIVAFDLNTDVLNSLKDELNFSECHALDVTNRMESQQLFDEINSRLGAPSYWINNAGIAYLANFVDQDMAHFDRVMDVNFNGLVFATHYWLRHMMKNNTGIIVNIASIAGEISAPTMSSYCASKAAVIAFSNTLQRELQVIKSATRIVVVKPGFVNTEIVRLGQKEGIPKEFEFMLSTPERCVREILTKIKKGDDEIIPTLNGKLMHAIQKITPGINDYLSVKFGEKKK